MQVIDKVENEEGVWFDPWPGVSLEEMAEIDHVYATYKLAERPLKAGK
jgi:hypothetical protein